MDITEDFGRALSLEGLRPSTIYHYVRDARRFCDWLEPNRKRPPEGDHYPGEDIPLPITDKVSYTPIHCQLAETTPALLREYLIEFRRTRKDKTLRESQIALRRFFRWLVAEGRLASDPTTGIKLAAFRTEPQPTYTDKEIRRLLGACTGVRDRALILTLYDTGIREGELISMGEVHWERRKVQVTGKTGTRNVPLGAVTIQALRLYTHAYGVSNSTLWWGERGPLTESGVLQLVRRLCLRAGVQHKGVHAFRRAAACQMKRLGMQDSDILEICGWKSVVMLRRYTATYAEELAQRAHDLYSPADNL